MSISTQKKSLITAKLKAGFVHFLISFSIFFVVVLWVRFFAYPSVYFSMAGAVQGLVIVFLVDVVLGPLLSFLVYNPAKSKKEMMSDFAIIGVVQFSALIYGIYTLNQEKPIAIIAYPNSSAAVISSRELADFPELSDLSSYGTLAKLPIVMYNPSNKTKPYARLDELSSSIASTDVATRKNIWANADDANALKQIEAKYGKVYVIGVMAKYNGAYIALDKDYRFVAKFGEKPIS